MSKLVNKMKKNLRNNSSSLSTNIISSDPSFVKRSLVQGVLPKGCSLTTPMSKRADTLSMYGDSLSNVSGFSGNNAKYHTQRPFLPEFDSPERQWYPRNIAQANYYWRMFYQYDPFFGTAVDMYSQMMISDFDIQLSNDDDPTIRNNLMEMCEQTKFLDVFQNLIREFLICGEAFPHCFFDSEKGRWSYVSFFNPDNMEVLDNPIINVDPIISYIPDESIISFLTQSTLEAQEIRSKLPSSFVSKVLAHQKIRLSDTNTSFVPRKLHPYDLRGTSLASRLWRIWMVEDAVYSSTIAIFRRHANALKVIKVGDPNTGVVGSPDAQDALIGMVKQAEIDPNAWLCTNYMVNFESWGGPDRAITLSREHDTIEKVKLLALGLSKSFMSGEVSFSSAKSGLQVFLRRLLSMRQFFEKYWIIPKFFGPIIKLNDWSKGTPAEVNHRIKIKRTAQEALDRNLLIIPKIKWRNKLDPSIDTELLAAYGQLKNFGFEVSQDTVGSAVSLDWKEELQKSAKEFKAKKEILQEVLGDSLKTEYEKEKTAPAKATPAGAPGSGAKPPTGAPSGASGKGSPAQGGSAPPGSAEEGNTPSNESVEPADSGAGKLV